MRIVEDDSGDFVFVEAVGVEFVVDGGKGAEFEVGDIGEDGGATGGDAVLDQEGGEAGEEVVDLDSGFEIGGFGAESGGEVGVDEFCFEAGGVAEAEGGVLRDGEVAAATGAGAVTASGDGE